MGKGDRRSKKGKIWNGSFGKSRLKASRLRKLKEKGLATASSAKSKSAKKAK